MTYHRFDPLSFTFGSLFAIAGLLLLTGGVDGLQMQWVGPLLALGLGMIILFAVRPRRPVVEEPDATPDEA